MVKGIGFAFALVLALSLSASAGELAGKVQSVNPGDHSFVLEDGTRLWMPDGSMAELTPGDKVLATYETQGDKKVVIGIDRRTEGSDGQDTTNFGSIPEVVQDGKTGFVCNGMDHLQRAVELVDSIKNDDCRADAVARFDRRVMARNYLAQYKRVMDGEVWGA